MPLNNQTKFKYAAKTFTANLKQTPTKFKLNLSNEELGAMLFTIDKFI